MAASAAATLWPVTHSDAVTFIGAATVTTHATLTDGAKIIFGSTLDGNGGVGGPWNLILNTGGPTRFGGGVGGVHPLRSLATNAGGTVEINGGAVTTTEGQTYGESATLGADTVLAGTPIEFKSTVNSSGGARSLTLNAASTIFRGAVGGTSPLASLTANSTTGITIEGSITTTGAQAYNGPTTIGSGVTLTGSTVTFGSTAAFGGAHLLTLAGAGSNAGALSGPGTILKSGTGTFVLSGTNTHTGGTRIGGGTLRVTGSTGAVTLEGGTVQGTGTVGALGATGAGGTVAPGASPGILSTGSITLNAATTAAFEVNGTTPGTGHDQLAVTGTVALGGATLQVIPGFTAASGDVFVIIANDGADPVSGTFAGLAEGATLTASGQTFRISYVGGTGNDVVLTAVVASGSTTSTTAPATTTTTAPQATGPTITPAPPAQPVTAQPRYAG